MHTQIKLFRLRHHDFNLSNFAQRILSSKTLLLRPVAEMNSNYILIMNTAYLNVNYL